MRAAIFAVLVSPVLLGASLARAQAEGSPVDRAPYVQLTTRSSAVVVWRTDSAITPVLRYGPAPGDLSGIIPAEQIVMRVSPEMEGLPEVPRLSETTPAGLYQFEATASGLAVDTKYYYGVFDGDTLLSGGTADSFFRTQPRAEPGRPLRFWVMGDSGDGGLIQKNVYEAMKAHVAGDGRPLDAFIHLGDMAYDDGTDPMFQLNFFDVYEETLRNTVTWSTMGNHEGHSANGMLGIGPYYDAYVLPTQGEAGGVPSGSEAYYSFDLGPIHFVCLNSHDEARGEADRMANWLRQDLAGNDSEWLIAFWHHPPYSKGSHHSDVEDQLVEMREVMMPILESHGVDLVLAGHSHIYERSMLMNRAYATPTTPAGVILDDGDGRAGGDGAYLKSEHLHPHEGTVAVVAGHGHGVDFVFGLLPVHRVSLQEGGSVLMDLEGDTMKVRMLNDQGAIRDEFEIVKRGQIAPRQALSDPWNPFGPAILLSEQAPGGMQVNLVAQPNVPDATVHYTTDGTEPTPSSPAYAAPFEIDSRTTVKALSVWRGGQRTSPVTSAELQPAAPGSLRYVRIPLLHSEDDAVESALGFVDLESPVVGMTSPEASWFGLRFRDVRVPQGVTVLSSFVRVRPALLGLDPAQWTVFGDLSDPHQPFTGELGGLSSRPRTESSAIWDVFAWTGLGFQVGSPDLSIVMEEVLQRPEWDPGGSIGLLVSGTGQRAAHSFDGAAASGAELWVAFDERDPLTIAAGAGLRVFVANGPDGGRNVYAAVQVMATAGARGFTFTLEGSRTLEPGSWEPLNASFAGSLAGAKVGFSHYLLQLSRSDGSGFGDDFYVRVRVSGE